ncbi:ABC transporter substrate-binding protein [Oceanobacter mangrovi]|uniref:ABC transporter substrate-binding protein n=1 Tax=Oceanobacter mangrovi TaxID=2862510 RepID=UPI001C8EDAC4|nr:sugar ABC transporter substrate-binding protein [Oceanobacter mangrovi]
MSKSWVAIFSGLLTLAVARAEAATELVVATVNNSHMIEMQKLSSYFEAAHPDIKLRWVVMEEGVLRQRVTNDVASGAGQFDVMTIGTYEAPIWGQRGWIIPLQFSASYDIDDLLPSIRSALSVGDQLVAAPFYGESSLLMYRKDLLDAQGLPMPERPKWQYIAEVASRIHDPKKGIYGICLRGKPGWGDNMALLSTMVNSWGGQWFDMNWKPQITSPPWQQAVSFYVELMNQYGPPNASANSFNELLAMFSGGQCGMWVDASIAASYVSDPQRSQVADQVAFAQAPTAVTDKGANWLWSWALAIPASSQKQQAAMAFVQWATSRLYIRLVGEKAGWSHIPTGTRYSTYKIPEFLQIARFAEAELEALNSANPDDSTLPPSPYRGVQIVPIPEFQTIGIAVGQQISAALAGKRSVAEALATGQRAAEREMIRRVFQPYVDSLKASAEADGDTTSQ